MRAWWLLIGVPGCAWLSDGEVDALVDRDGDGFAGPEFGGPDCDDDDDAIHPGTQLGETPQPVFADRDGDGAGDPAVTALACALADGWAAAGDDCDDADAEIGTGVVQHRDADGDTFGRAEAESSSSCDGPDAGFVENGLDCDDGTDAIGTVSPVVQYRDEDDDGLGDPAELRTEPSCTLAEGYVEVAGDCDDTDAAIGGGERWWPDADGDFLGDPAGTVVTDCAPPVGYVGNDTDCDDADETVGGQAVQYADVDGDGYGDLETRSLAVGCARDADKVDNGLDCDDGDARINPDTAWYPDGDLDGIGAGAVVHQCLPLLAGGVIGVRIDGDCDDGDSGIGAETWPDLDGDGWGALVGAGHDCAGQVAFRTGDCDDGDPTRHPETVWYVDGDGDGFGTPLAPPTISCVAVSGAVREDPLGFDCDDADAAIHPLTWWYPDVDADGFGDGDGTPLQGCVVQAPDESALAVVTGDCDDADPKVTDRSWADPDGDGYGADATEQIGNCDPGRAFKGGDCNENEPLIHRDTVWADDLDGDGFVNPFSSATTTQCVSPGTTWLPLPVDVADHDCAEGNADLHPDTTWYVDADFDGVGTDVNPVVSCFSPAVGDQVDQWVLVGGDCDDLDTNVTDVGYPDQDLDGFGVLPGSPGTCADAGFAAVPGDCDDTDADERPGVSWHPDEDGDGFGDARVVGVCERPGALGTYVEDDSDCDDADGGTNPGILTDPDRDGIDADCDGTDLDAGDDGLPDIGTCGNVVPVPVSGPAVLADRLSTLQACQALVLAPGEYPAFQIPASVRGDVMIWGPEPGVRIVGDTVGIDILETGAWTVLEGLELVGFDGGAVRLDTDSPVELSNLVVGDGNGLVGSTKSSPAVHIYGTAFQGTTVAVGSTDRKDPALHVSDAILRRVSLIGGLSAQSGIDLAANGRVEVSDLQVAHSAALNTYLRVSADSVDAHRLEFTDGLAKGALFLSAAKDVIVSEVEITGNGFVPDRDGAVVELRGQDLVSVADLTIQDNVTDGEMTWIAACGVAAPCADNQRATTTMLRMRDVVLTRNDSTPDTTGLRLWVDPSTSDPLVPEVQQLALHQPEGRWLITHGDLTVDHATLAGLHTARNVTGASRIAVDGSLTLANSIVQWPAADVADMALVAAAASRSTLRLGAIQGSPPDEVFSPTLVDPGVVALCGSTLPCSADVVSTGPAGLRRSLRGMDPFEADLRLATTCPPGPPFAGVVPCQNSAALLATPDLGARAPDYAPALYPDSEVGGAGDGLLDDWEFEWFGSLAALPEEDPDGDGLTNRYESNIGTDPLSPNSDGDAADDADDAEPLDPFAT